MDQHGVRLAWVAGVIAYNGCNFALAPKIGKWYYRHFRRHCSTRPVLPCDCT